MKVLCVAIPYLKFMVVLFWQKEIGKKAAHNLLVTLTKEIYNCSNGKPA